MKFIYLNLQELIEILSHMRVLQIRLWLFFLFLSTFSSTIAQNQQLIDSLLEKLESKISDKEQVGVLTDLAWEFFYTDTSTFNAYISDAIQLAEGIGYLEGKIDAIHTTARSYLLRGFFGTAKIYYGQTIALAREIRYEAGEAYGINGYGHLKMYMAIF